MSGNKGVMLLLATLVLAAVCGISSAKSVVVGDTTGWTIPPTPSFYSNWASQQNLQVGDVLVFNFPTGAHTVAQVSKANYDLCTTSNTIGQVMTTAPANITLTQPGTHHFICTVTGHCDANQKLTVTASASTTSAPKPSPPSKKSPTPSPSSSPTPSPSPFTTPTPSGSATALPISPVASGPDTSAFPMGPTGAGGPTTGAGSTPPPAANFAVSTGVSVLSLLSFIVASALLF